MCLAVYKSQCPVLGREGVHPAGPRSYTVDSSGCLNAPCWGARVCTLAVQIAKNDGLGAVSQCPVLGREGVHQSRPEPTRPKKQSQCPVLGREGVHQEMKKRLEQESRQVSMPRAGARGCAPLGVAGLLAPLMVSQCPVLGREGVHLSMNALSFRLVSALSQCPVLGREGVHLI